MTRTENRSTRAVMALIVAAFICGYFVGKSAPDAPVACAHPERTRDALRIALNEKRLEAGRPQAADTKVLEDYAEFRLEEITKSQNFTHETDTTLVDWAKQHKRQNELETFSTAGGEALHQSRFNTCVAVDSIFSSPTHRDGILRAETFGLAINDQYFVVITGDLK